MRISAIKSGFYQKPLKTQNQTNTNFRGYTHVLEGDSRTLPGCLHSPVYVTSYIMPENLQETGTKLEYNDLTEYERNLYSWVNMGYKKPEGLPPRIYIASPHEVIEDWVYKKHTHIQRNDLFLSQIKKDYVWGYKNFASNAYLEEQNYIELQKKRDETVAANKKEIERLKKECETFSNSLPSENLKKQLHETYNKKIAKFEQENEKVTSNAKYADENIEKAKKRFVVLKKIDDISGEINSKRHECYNSKKKLKDDKEKLAKNEKLFERIQNDYKKRVERLNVIKDTGDFKNKKEAMKKAGTDFENNKKSVKKETLKTKKSIGELKHEISVLESKIKKIETKEIPALEKKLDEEYKNTEKFYREYYPEWADV